MPTSVFVSGATGYLAQHIVKLLLSKGFHVVGSVRTPAKGEALKKQVANEAFSYEVIPKLDSPGAFDEAVKKHPEVTIFLHTASPANLTSTDVENEVLKPAVKGTENALSAIQKYGPQITKVVVTSSVVAMLDPAKIKDRSYTFTEESWNPVTWEESKANGHLGYMASKKYAEKAVWDFVEKENPSFTVNTVNPVFVTGPQAYDEEVKEELPSTAETINKLLKLQPDSEIPPIDMVFVDVRDIAKAHLVAFESDLSNQRLAMCEGTFTSQKIIDIINKRFDEFRGKLPVGKPGTGDVANIANLDNTKTREALKIPFIDLETSVVDVVSQILRVRGAPQ